MSERANRLWIDSLVLGILGVAFILSQYLWDWLPTILRGPTSAYSFGRQEVGATLLFVGISFLYLFIRSATSRTRPLTQVPEVVLEARALTILADDFLHKLGGAEAAKAFLQTCLDQAQLVTGATGSAVHLVEGDELVYAYAGGTPPPNVGKEPLQRSLAGEAARTNKAVLVQDARKDPRFAGALPGQLTYASLLVVPIPYGNRVLGTLRVIHPAASRFDNIAVESLRPITLLMGAAIWRAHDVDEKDSVMRERAEAVARAEAYERRFEALAQNLDRGLIMVDAAGGQVLWANDKSAAILGKPVDTILANPRNRFEGIEAEDRKRVDKELPRLSTSGGHIDYRIQRGKELAWVREQVAPVRDQRGNIVAVLAILSEETRIRQIEEEFETVQRRLGFPLEDAPLVFYALRPSGNYGMTFVSPNVEKVLGYGSAEFLADPVFWTAQLHPDEQAEVFGQLPALFQKGTLRQSYRFRHADGSYKILDDVMTLIRTPDGTPVEIVGYWMDITERVRLEEGVQYSLNRIKELQDSRTRLLNTISHDLANPITPIRLQLSLLQPSLKETPQARNLDIIARNVETLNRLIQDLKDVARLEAGKLKVDPVPGEIIAVVQGAVESFQGHAIEKGIVLESKLSKPVTVPFDEQRVTQVLFNFLSNAMKFTPQGGLITVHAFYDKDQFTVRVTDSGRGLTEEEMARLFKPFSQIHDRSEMKEKGTGLGLYICKGLIESHGGRVFVESPGHGKGSTFGFSLPMKASAPLTVSEEEEEDEAEMPEEPSSPTKTRSSRARSSRAKASARGKGSKLSRK